MVVLTGALAGGCDPTTYTDLNFGTNVGADYMAPAPVRDAGDDSDTQVNAPGSAAGTVGTAGDSAAGTVGTAGDSAAETVGTAGVGGSAGSAGGSGS